MISKQDELGVYCRRACESAKAFEAYCEYRDFGAKRSLEVVGQKLGKTRSFLSRWSSRWDWVKRTEAYDADLAAKEWAAKEFALRAEAEKWAKRQEEYREVEFQRLLRLGEKVEQALQFPFQTVEHKEPITLADGTQSYKITIIKPLNRDLRGIASALALYLKGTRLSLNMATEHTTTTVQGVGPGGAILVRQEEQARMDERWLKMLPTWIELLDERGDLARALGLDASEASALPAGDESESSPPE